MQELRIVLSNRVAERIQKVSDRLKVTGNEFLYFLLLRSLREVELKIQSQRKEHENDGT
jgi:hypothetical protein